MNEKEKEITIRLFGDIGGSIDGDRFANDLALLDKQFGTINLHINSPGGNVSQGYSIVSVMLSMKAHVNVYVVGIAASMAAVIAVCGDEVFMYDYSRLMIHDPFFSTKDSKQLTNKDRNALANVTASLRTILTRRGKEQDEISHLMKEETWFDATEAERTGLIDGIISTKRRNEFKGFSSNDIFSRISAEYTPTDNNKSTSDNMDLLQQLAEILGLTNPTEEQIIQTVKALVNNSTPEGVEVKLNDALQKGIVDASSYENLRSMGNNSPEAFNEYMERLNNDFDAKMDEKVNNYFQEIRAKFYYVSFNDKQKLREYARNNFEMFVNLTRLLPDRKPLSQELADVVNRGDAGKSSWTLNDYRKLAPEELRRNPQLYEKLVNKENK